MKLTEEQIDMMKEDICAELIALLTLYYVRSY